MAQKYSTNPATGVKTISVIGTGDYARALAKRLLSQGFDVVCGSRSPGKRNLQKIDPELASIRVATLPDTVAASGIIFVAVPFEGHTDTLKPLESMLVGKILIDISNPNKISKHGPSNAEKLAELLPQSHVVKAFNTVSAYAMEYNHTGVSGEVQICGDNADARAVVRHLASEMGFTVVEKGGLKVAREMEKIPLQLLPGWGIPSIVIVIVFAIWTGFLIYKEHYMGKKSWSEFPCYTMNKIMAAVSINLLALCYLGGCVAAFKQLCQCTKYTRFPVWLDEWLKMRKQLGLFSLFFAACHCIASVVLMTPAYYPYYFERSERGFFSIPANQTKDLKVPIALKMEWKAETFIILGVIALGVMAIIGITSLPSVGQRMNWREWTFMQSQLGYFCLLLAIAHVLLRGIGYWTSFPITKVLQSPAFVASVIPWLTIFLKIILLTPCLYIPLRKIRRGWEPCVKYQLVSAEDGEAPKGHDNACVEMEVVRT